MTIIIVAAIGAITVIGITAIVTLGGRSSTVNHECGDWSDPSDQTNTTTTKPRERDVRS